jgi:hypothetical protein
LDASVELFDEDDEDEEAQLDDPKLKPARRRSSKWARLFQNGTLVNNGDCARGWRRLCHAIAVWTGILKRFIVRP